jgi:NAD(P)-dependent dehydrogenase (short-subunit alcohol dehydrogenase family)
VERRVAIVTGAGRGIGRATALALASRGARVLGVSRTEDDLASLADEAPIEVLAESVATEEGCDRIVAEARHRLGPVEILVLNAGIGSGHEREIWAQETSVWRESMAVNLDGPFFLCRAASEDMKEGGWGRIVMVSSTSGEVGSPSTSAYTASKHGLMGLMRSVAQDLGPHGATCNAVLPGWVRTEMAERSARIEAERGGVGGGARGGAPGRAPPRDRGGGVGRAGRCLSREPGRDARRGGGGDRLPRERRGERGERRRCHRRARRPLVKSHGLG